MKTLKGRKFFFATRNDLLPGLQAIEQTIDLAYVLHETRDDTEFTIIDTVSSYSSLGQTTGHDVNTSPIYLVFRRGEVPPPTRIPQKHDGDKFHIEPRSHCAILRAGGVHASGALIAGELQEPLHATPLARDLVALLTRELFRGFERIKLYRVGPEALRGLRSGQRLVTIAVGSPHEYDLSEHTRHPKGGAQNNDQ